MTRVRGRSVAVVLAVALGLGGTASCTDGGPDGGGRAPESEQGEAETVPAPVDRSPAPVDRSPAADTAQDDGDRAETGAGVRSAGAADGGRGGAPGGPSGGSSTTPPRAPGPSPEASGTPPPEDSSRRRDPPADEDDVPPPAAEAIVRRAAAAYDSLRSLRARFRQVLEMRVFDPPRRREGRGTWYQRKPAFLRMDFSEPEGDVIVSDGDHLWLYYPSTHPGQVIRTGFASPSRGAAMVDLQGRIFRRARTSYRPEYGGRERVTGRPAHLLVLVPRDPGTRYRRVRVWVDVETHLVRRLEFHDRSETVRTITLEGLEPNVPLADSLFRFEPPPDAEVFRG